MDKKKIPTAVYAEMTPNPTTMKFVVDRELVVGNLQLEFQNSNDALLCSPLAVELFNFPFVSSVFISGSIVSVSKDDSLGWEMIVMQLREYIREWLEENEVAVDSEKALKVENELSGTSATIVSPESNSDDKGSLINDIDIVPSPHDDNIIQLLDEYVRPAVEQDGGAIDFVAFKEGTVFVNLRGACSGCPSSTQTLKGGIEQLLKSKIEAVKEVVATGV